MAPKPAAKTKAQELQRIRENQQRSRDRRRTYIAELEEDVRRLNERLSRCEPCEAAKTAKNAWSMISVENEARTELLQALGIDEAAQEQFVRAFTKRTAAKEVALDLQTAKVESTVGKEPASVNTQNATLNNWAAQPGVDSRFEDPISYPQSLRRPKDAKESGILHTVSFGTDSPILYRTSMSPNEPASLENKQAVAEVRRTPAPNNTLFSPSLDSQTLDSRPLDQQTLFTPCLWNATAQANTCCSESKTGCSVAFSMLLANNSRGYTFADLDARLQAAYRQDDSVAEGCSVLNKVLFELLGEIS